ATYAGDEPDRIAADLGAESFLSAPVDPLLLTQRVRAILEGRHVRTLPRVLIVEDSRTLAGMLRTAFNGHGYQADTASTVAEALAAFRGAPYDVAVLDYHLPDGLGDTLLDTFRNHRPTCVCLMMTTDPGPELALDWMKRGAADYLRKPFQVDFLLELCSRARRERALLRVQDMLEQRTRELRASEEKSRQAAEFARHILDSTDAHLAVVDGEGTILDVNEAWRRFARSNGAGDESLWGPGASYFRNDTCGHPSYEGIRCVQDGRLPSFEVEYPCHAPTEERWFSMRVQPFQGRPGTVLVAHFDVTVLKRAETDRETLQLRLLQAQKMESIGRLAGGVAHDFNNMLCVIIGLGDLLLSRTDPAHPFHAHLTEIHRAAERSSDLTRQLLAFARRQAIAPKVLDLNPTVEDMFKMLRRLIGEDILLTWAPGPDLWRVRLDPSQIDQILANLCVNSRDAIRDVGTINISTQNLSVLDSHCLNRPGLAPGDYVLLTVCDDGQGMDEATRKLIFEPFFTTKEVGKGTGLGLATVYGIVKQNRGWIEVESEPGQGTTITIYLPRDPGQAGPKRLEGPPVRPGQGRETILLVEDEPAILVMATDMLRELGYRILPAATPAEALLLAEGHRERIDLVLADLVLPVMNGRDLARALRALHPEARTLFMSGYAAGDSLDAAVRDDGAPFLQKPFSLKELEHKVREALGAS
ncbi:MAG: response regulator, partial [Holophaga sp.]|nr:response regulator [Holophaga sp.]